MGRIVNDLYRRGLCGKHLQLIITDGCAGLAGAIQAVYPRILHQRCWVHKMRTIREKGRKRDRDELKRMAQATYLAQDRKQARLAFRCFKLRWQAVSHDGEAVREGSAAAIGVL